MSTKKSPLGRTKDEHESKEKLVDKLITLLGQLRSSDESKEDLKGRLLAASNKKLLTLMTTANALKTKYGSIDKAAEALAQALGRAKDADYVKKLKSFTPGRLLDLHKSAEKRTKKAA